MSMSDEELDRDWKPSGRRPQSTIARSFSQELMDIFRIENSVADLDEQVDKRKHQITNQTTELEALEARIREMEKRLQQSSSGRSIASSLSQAHNQQPSSPRSSRPAVANAFQSQDAQAPPPPPPAKDYTPSHVSQNRGHEHKYGARPPSSRQPQQAVPGQLPPTPTASEGEYELVTRARPVPVSGGYHQPRPSGLSSQSQPQPIDKSTVASISGDDSASVLSESTSFADYVVVARSDGDEQDV